MSGSHHVYNRKEGSQQAISCLIIIDCKCLHSNMVLPSVNRLPHTAAVASVGPVQYLVISTQGSPCLK